MRAEVLQIALLTGAFTYAFRFFPTRANLGNLSASGPLARLLSALGPAAITALFVAEILPELSHPLSSQGPLLAGTAATILTFRLSHSVVGATLAGSFGYGLVLAIFG